MDVDSGSESSSNQEEEEEEEVEMDERTKAEMEALEQSKKLLAITAENQRETFDILRNLDNLEEIVTNKKLESSTIEQLNIDWKERRKQTLRIERRQNTIKRRLKRKKERERERKKQNEESNQDKPEAATQANVEEADSCHSNDIDLDGNENHNVDAGTFDHLPFAHRPVEDTQLIESAQKRQDMVMSVSANSNSHANVPRFDGDRVETQMNDLLSGFTPTVATTMNVQSNSGLNAMSLAMDTAANVSVEEDIDLSFRNSNDSEKHGVGENIDNVDGERVKQEAEEIVAGNDTHDLLAELEAFSSTL